MFVHGRRGEPGKLQLITPRKKPAQFQFRFRRRMSLRKWRLNSIPPYTIKDKILSHTIHQKDKLIARVRRLKGQLEGVERALTSEAGCAEILRQLASVRGAMNGLTAEVMEDHLREHVLAAETETERRQGGGELIDIIRTYLK